MKKELQTRQIAGFALNASYQTIGQKNIEQLKRHLLDALASLIHASDKPTIQKLVRQMQVMGENGPCEVPLLGKLPYDRAAQLYTALIRYPDFMDNFMAKEATCHPSDNIGALFAAAQFRKCSGREFLAAMAVAYQIECRLVQEIPVMKEGIDHTLMLAYSATAAAARLIGLGQEQTAHALGIIGSSISPMVTSRASYTYEWKGMASSMDVLECLATVFLAREGMTGPIAIFEGPKGFKDIFGMKLDYDWTEENFELLSKCVLKEFNAEVHSQPSLEAITDLRMQHNIEAEKVKKIDITTFLTAYHIIGSGAYGDRQTVETKEQADHSLFYLAAVALIDGEVYPEQLEPGRINKKDVQDLLQKISVKTGFPLHQPVTLAGLLDPYTEAYPDKVKAKVEITLYNGSVFSCEKEDYHGFFTRPFTWEDTIQKFQRLTSPILPPAARQQIIDGVRGLELLDDVNQFITMLAGQLKKAAP